MADKAISELIEAPQITSSDMFVLEQNGVAKKLTGQVLLNWLTAAADGHGGIQSIEKTGTSGLVDTYTITLADTTTYTITVTNGKGVVSFTKTGTSGLVDIYTMKFTDDSTVPVEVHQGRGIQSVQLTSTVGLRDTYTITFNDNTTQTFIVTNGAKGDKGDNAYVHFKWASQEPTEESHSFGDIPDDWIGIYTGNETAAPEDWNAYKWFLYKGEKGDIGTAATMTSQEVAYQVSDLGTVPPSGQWSNEVPTVLPGKFLWTRVTLQFNSGEPVVSYSVSRMGIDGTGAVSTVNSVAPDSQGNVLLSASNVGAMSSDGGTFYGSVNMNGQMLNGLVDPSEATQAVNKKTLDGAISAVNQTITTLDGAISAVNQTITTLDGAISAVICTLADSEWSAEAPYTQEIAIEGMTADWTPGYPVPVPGATTDVDNAIRAAYANVHKVRSEVGKLIFTCPKQKPEVTFTLRVPGMLM